MIGLVIKQPWIDLILNGHKVWEIRGKATAQRGKIALIQSKSGTVVGICNLVGCVGPLSLDDLRREQSKHRIPLASLETLPYPTTYAWVVESPQRTEPPVPYKHPNGAVIWVRLNSTNCPQIERLA